MTKFHGKISRSLRRIRNDKIWLNGEDICHAFKAMKMGLRMTHLCEPWDHFRDGYERVLCTTEKLYDIQMSNEEKEEELD